MLGKENAAPVTREAEPPGILLMIPRVFTQSKHPACHVLERKFGQRAMGTKEMDQWVKC